ncbi:hypothetical protein SAMD00019534_097310 [Acytostelium subglobosum LB1]|uniref:hypothetical protein n=1 Tax=Acytostelium subglobosum LB1 TaxID=1410327 RepID=UPI000644CFE9|nr:hypothetical protein SAMD00019534_097310 [Acytostelium subglobosum LB1]GAM26556.1 hypothetical protein SAMD00019534_097310 [Acytostelium subglobosum LB1]|eukprot:XP_012750652.1 hypothetical protein SAMD00019534_097310 [Acytostelium subglobosum LB1]
MSYLDCLTIRSSAEYSDDPSHQELEVLKTIYGDSFVQLDDYTFNLRLSVNLQDGFTVSIRNDLGHPDTQTTSTTSTTTTTTTTNTTAAAAGKKKADEPNKYSIVGLPVVSLGWQYPDSYPSFPPSLFLSCCWMTPADMDRVIKKIYSMWEEGELVMFKYAEWIRDELMPFLCQGGEDNEYLLSNKPITIRHPEDDDDVDVATIDESVDSASKSVYWEHQEGWSSLASALPSLLQFNRHEAKQRFLQTYHTCPVCFDELPGAEFNLLACGHHLCTGCTKQICLINTDSGDIQHIRCTEHNCNQPLDQQVIKQYLGAEAYAAYEKMMSMFKGYRECLRCHAFTARFDKIAVSFWCETCTYSSCPLCSRSWHPGVPCNYQPPKREINVEESRPSMNLDNFVTRQIKETVGIIEGDTGKYLAETNSRMCPNCGVIVTKVEGCNKVVCALCKKYFCWKCLSIIDGYSHFGGDCGTFETTTAMSNGQLVGVWSARLMREKNKLREAFAKEFREKVKLMPAVLKCVNCKTLIGRTNNNNHLKCYNCSTQMCYMCKQAIQGTKHYSTSGCKQHGDQ